MRPVEVLRDCMIWKLSTCVRVSPRRMENESKSCAASRSRLTRARAWRLRAPRVRESRRCYTCSADWRPPDHGSITAFRRERIGFVFQFHYLLPDLSAIENVALPSTDRARKTRRGVYERAQLLRKTVGLADRLDHPISHLSGGEQQRVAVARAIDHRTKVVVSGRTDRVISTRRSVMRLVGRS